MADSKISDRSKVVIVVPTYNERENLPRLTKAILALPVTVDLLFVDDNSPDGTGQIAEELAARSPRIKVLHREGRGGLGTAYIAGFTWAMERKYELIMQMDADLSHDPNAVPRLLEQMEHCDAVFGSRYLNGVRVQNWSFRRLLLSKASNEFIRIMLGLPCTDTTTAFKCFRRSVLEKVDLRTLSGKRNAFLIHLVYRVVRAGFRTAEVPFTFYERESGESKMELKVAAESLLMVLRLACHRLFRR